MKSNVEKVGSLGRKINIQVPAEVVAAAFDQTFKNVQKKANIKGFRPGKAPLATIKSIYASEVAQDVVQDLVQKHYFAAVKEHKLQPVSYPEFEFDPPKENTEFSFTAAIEVRPEVELKKYENFEVLKEKLTVPETEVDKVIANILSSRAELVPVLEDRAAQTGDVAVIDFDGSSNGAPIQGGSAQGHELELGSKQFIPGFEEGIVGMKIGSEKTISLKFPEDYHPPMAGQPAEFKVVLKGLKKKNLPKFDDAFVAELMRPSQGEATKTAAEFRETILKDLKQTEEKRIENEFKERVMKKLVEFNPVEIPPTMLADQKKMIIEDIKEKNMKQGMSEAEFTEYVKKWDTDFSAMASQMLQAGFLIDSIAAKHDLGCNDKDLEQRFAEHAAQFGIDTDRIKEFYKDKDRLNQLVSRITEEKVMAHINKTLKIAEVNKEQLKN